MKIYIKISLGILSILAMILANWLYQPQSEHVHLHAGFVVHIDGVRQDYSDYKYMNLTPCSEHDVKKSAKEEQIERAHLHDSVGDVVHVHRAGATWGDLFKNIQVKLPTDLKILKQVIEPNSSIVIVIGEKIDNPEKVTIEHIKEVEAKSELCGT